MYSQCLRKRRLTQLQQPEKRTAPFSSSLCAFTEADASTCDGEPLLYRASIGLFSVPTVKLRLPLQKKRASQHSRPRWMLRQWDQVWHVQQMLLEPRARPREHVNQMPARTRARAPHTPPRERAGPTLPQLEAFNTIWISRFSPIFSTVCNCGVSTVFSTTKSALGAPFNKRKHLQSKCPATTVGGVGSPRKETPISTTSSHS